ncbi:MAG TPA: fibronectin type III domain-containing protein, partial [Tepidisphaeraceae bacterium]|nr:fibronectin type III domain-containing protein [Tepidisphaeraceae bacterium]
MPGFVHLSTGAVVTVTGSSGNPAINISGGTATIDANLASAGGSWQVNASGTSTVVFNSPETIAGLSISNSAKVAISSGTSSNGGNANVLDITNAAGLYIDTSSTATATLDIGDDDMILEDGAAAGVAQIQSLAAEGFAGAAWTGNGLTSSKAAATAGSSLPFAIGFGMNSALHSPFSSLDGIALNSDDVLVKTTLYGDIALNGVVTNATLNIFRQHFPVTSGSTWATGDFDYNGSTNNDDLNWLRHDFQGDISADNAAFLRTINAFGETITPVEGQALTAVVAQFTDNSAQATDASDYQATIYWGDGNTYTGTVTSGGGGVYYVTGTSLPYFSNADALSVAVISYTTASGFFGRPGALSEPINVIPAVESLTATTLPTAGIELNWTLNATLPTEIDVYRSTDGVEFPTDPTFVIAGAAVSHSDMDVTLAANTHYYYEIRAIQPDYGPSQFTNVASAWTVPSAPTQIATPAISDTSVLLTWLAPAGGSPPSSYEILRNGVEVGTSIGTAFQDTGLAAGTNYTYDVVANGPTNAQSPVGPLSVTTAALDAADAPPPPSPGDPTATSSSAYSAQLSWELSANAVAYEVLRDGVVVGSTSSDVFDDTNLAPSTSYQYSIVAFDANGNSSPPAVTSVTTSSDDNVRPSTPTDLLVTANSSSGITLTWSPASDDVGVTDYAISVVETNASGTNVGSFTGSSNNLLTYTTGSTTPGITYTFSVAAVDAAGNQSPSATVAVVAAAPATVEDTASNQYIPPEWQDYFYNSLTPAVRSMVQIVGLPQSAQGWLDPHDMTIIDGQVQGLFSASDPYDHKAVYYHDTNENQQFDPGEAVWFGTSTYHTGDQIIAGAGVQDGTAGSSGLLSSQDPSTIDADHPFDLSKVLLVDPNEIKGVQGQLAYRDVNGAGYWQSGDPIWVDA